MTSPVFNFLWTLLIIIFYFHYSNRHCSSMISGWVGQPNHLAIYLTSCDRIALDAPATIWPIFLIRITRSKLHFVSPSDFICSPCTTGYFKLDVSNKKVIFPFLTLNLRRRRSFAMAARISLSALLKSLQDIKVTKMTIFRRHENIRQCHFDGWKEINNLPPQLKASIHSDQINRLLGKGNQIRNINDWISIR